MPVKKILVTGATGFLGRAVVDHLLDRGRTLRAAVRRELGLCPRGVEVVAVGDLSEATDWTAALVDVDAVVHCAGRAHVLRETADDPLVEFRAVNTAATLALARQAAQAGVRRLIFISSIGVNGAETSGRGFRHDDPPNPHSPYAVSKAEAEEGLTAIADETGLEVVIIRPPLITGRDPKGNLATLNSILAKGLPLPFGLATKNRRDLVSREVLSDLIDVVIDHPEAAGQTFLVSDGAPVSTRALLEQMAAAEGRSLTLLPVPTALMSMPLKMAGKGAMASQLFGDLEVDIEHTKATLNWSPPGRG
ncbi:NAD-dependent epimerase/dehydratase family protein [Brevundimonas lenta]|uniref:Nucleoside-diphosphate-sugar epimerase n=1 Tax=Brevundimonas lenta TaxID=424796 RepID=A0A7W6JFH2_9CAUL|nr:NAD-dependent epimerase/dehydratase family protein [Brevundimonas lenta]MBB4084131.1 nucleoside-diphosphate-sugar epimerase [Brevundimonas lenta]